ncbi:MAG TPA: hypothetical protein VMX18_04400 [Candidatus Bipolaricaulota bacterium]|nr:hypothetical protein [Candidatus Bipolaricaulota bacterium]
MPLYRIILRRAWQISWKRKWLWFLGFFAAFLSNETIYESIISGFNSRFSGQSFSLLTKNFFGQGIFDIFNVSFLKTWWTSGATGFTYLLLLTVAFVSLLLFFIFISVISQAGLIKAAIASDVKQPYGLKRALRDGIDHFWPVLGLNIVTKGALFGILAVIAYGVSLLIKVCSINAIDYILTALFVLILVFGSLLIYYLTIYGTAFIVLRGKKIFSSIKLSWSLFFNNFLINLEMALILFCSVVILSILLIAALFILSAPLILLTLLLGVAAAAKGVIVIAALWVVLVVLMVFFFGSWYSTFQISCWAILFEELALKRGRSKIARIFDSMKNLVKKTPAKKRKPVVKPLARRTYNRKKK